MSYDTTNQLLSEDEQMFRQNLIEYFKPYTKYSLTEKGIECIRSSLQSFASHLNEKKLASIYLDAVFAVIEICRITNGDLIRNTLEEYLLLILSRRGMIEEKLEPPNLFRCFPKIGIIYQLTIPRRNEVFSLNSFLYHNFILFYPIHTQRLLRYGLRFVFKDEDIRRYKEDWIILHLESTKLAEFSEEGEERMFALLNEHYPTYYEQRRMYFILVHIHIVTLKEIKKNKIYKNLLKSLKLLYMSIPDPVITISEVERFLKITLKGRNEDNRILSYCKLFESTFPTIHQPVQPRTLEHLCRCQVRENLIQARKHPHGVWSLELPESLRNSILLEDSEDEVLKDYLRDLAPEEGSNYEPGMSNGQNLSRAQ